MIKREKQSQDNAMSGGVSVVIPAYKARRYLPDCLESVGGQTLLPLEVFVIDDASPEPIDDIVDSFAVRDGFPSIRLIKHEVNRGQAAGRNTGIRASSGNWIAFLDCDDIWAPDHLRTVVETAERNAADMGFCPAVLFSENPRDPNNYHLVPLTEEEKALQPIALLNRCFIITSSTVIRSESLKEIDGFDESKGLRGVEDLDLFLRLLRKGATFRMAEEPTLFYRKHAGSATGTPGQLARQDVAVKRRHLEWVDATVGRKRAIMVEAHWRAAAGLWLAGASDRLEWLVRAIGCSLWSPGLALRAAYRFVRSIRRGTCTGM